MICIYCDNKKLYQLKTGQVKCSSCKKKFSPRKVELNRKVIKFFCQNYTANQTAKNLNLNYITVKKKYEHIRKHIAIYLENEYQNKQVIQYDEYIYLEQSKKKIKENIFDAQDFITFNYEDKVYNLLMPNLNRYKDQFLDDGIDETYFKEFSKFMMLNKISKIQRKQNIIQRFWYFFEDSILKYKGIDKKNFFFYLKEIEFKFNYTKQEQEEILYNIKPPF
jgi:transposase-like protein